MELRKKRKGLFYTADALLAVSILLIFMLVAVPLIKVNVQKSDLQYDLMLALSSTNVGEYQNAKVKSLITNGEINDTSKSVLEAIAEVYVTNPARGREVAQSIIDELDTNQKIGIWIDDRIVANNSADYNFSNNVDTTRQFITGVKEPGVGETITGYSARAFLSKSMQTNYYYFGGYFGDGNITLFAEYNGTISSAEIEIASNEDFRLFVNDVEIGNSYNAGENERTPVNYSIPVDEFFSGMNNVTLISNSSKLLRISGGYLKINYQSEVYVEPTKRYYFPAIKGIFNVYDSLYLPDINSMKVNVSYNSSYETFLQIGNVTIFEETNLGGGKINQYKDDSDFISDFGGNYNSISEENVPLRFGLSEILPGFANGNYDIVLVTDMSGSMKKALNNVFSNGNSNLDPSDVADCFRVENGDPTLDPNRRTDIAQCLDLMFARQVISDADGNQLWPVGMYGASGVDNYAGSSTSYTQIRNQILGYPNQGSGSTCVSCAINKGYDILKNSESGRQKVIILMTDGVPSHCSEGNNCRSNSTVPTNLASEYCKPTNNIYGFCDTNGDCDNSDVTNVCSSPSSCQKPIDNAYYSAQRAKNDLNITIHTIGFGVVEQCGVANQILLNISNMTGGKFFYGNSTGGLSDIYDNLADDLVTLVYDEQIANATGNISTELYAGSYIEFEYTEAESDPGLRFSLKSNFINQTSGNFSIPAGSSFIDARVVSYSGAKWTDKVRLNNNWIFNITRFGKEYVELGDPFNIYLPNEQVLTNGAANNVSLTLAPNSSSIQGSIHDKIIYTITKNISTFTNILSKAIGCEWNIKVEGDGYISIKVPSTYVNTMGKALCSYDSPSSANYDANDAYDVATYNILKELDFNGVNGIDVDLAQEFFDVLDSKIEGIPYETFVEVQVRTWS